MATTESPLVTQLDQIPERGLEAVRRGYEIVSGLTPEARATLVDYVSDLFVSQTMSFDGEEVAAKTNLSSRDIPNVIGAIAITVSSFTGSTASPDEFIDAARGKIFEVSVEPAFREIVDILSSRRDSLSAGYYRTGAERAVLPSLELFDIVVDFRIIKDDDQIKDFVPIAAVRIDTDYNNNEICFQLSRVDVEDIIKKLQNSLKDMDRVDAFRKQITSGQENKMQPDHMSFLSLYGYTAAGAIILWGKLAKREGRKIHFLSDWLIRYILNETARKIIEPIIFVAFGTYVAVGLIDPSTERQAFAAGLGWTGLATK